MAAHPVARFSALSLLALVVDRTLGLGLLVLVAALFGASEDADAYLLAYIVPTTLGIAVAEGLYTALLPRFEVHGRRIIAKAIGLTILVAGVVGLSYGGIVLLVPLSEDRVWLALAPIAVTMPIAGTFAALLVSERRYLLAAMRMPLASALALVGGLAVAHRQSVIALALAVALGHVTASAVFAVAVAHRTDPRPAAQPLALRSVLGPVASVFATTLIGGQIVVLLERALAAGLSAGSVSLISYARSFALIPILLPQALAAGLFPAAAERHVALDYHGLRRLAIRTMRIGLVAAFAAGALIIVARRELVRLVLERGELDAAEAITTARLIAILSVSLVGLAASTVAVRMLFALDSSSTVAAITSAGIALYGVVAVVLRQFEGIDGLAAAYSGVSVLTGFALAGVLARALNIPASSVLRDWVVAPLVLATAFGAGAVIGAAGAPDGETALNAAGAVVLAAAGGTFALGLVALLMRGAELELLRSRFGR
jgi:putative peptidoglycan lipid II flippase